MPRKRRMYIPNVPVHVVQRGNNRSACFYAEQDYQFYLACLEDACSRYQVQVHAYVLMTNHVHLLMTPNCKLGISKVLQSVGRRYVLYVNKTYQRSGALWEGRHKSSLVDSDYYLLACYRYIELNPVRAGMVVHPLEYRWSSYRVNSGSSPMKACSLLTPHSGYSALGSNATEQQKHYRYLFDLDLAESELTLIRNASQFNMPVGNHRFYQEVEEAIGHKIGQAHRGRPKTTKLKIIETLDKKDMSKHYCSLKPQLISTQATRLPVRD